MVDAYIQGELDGVHFEVITGDNSSRNILSIRDRNGYTWHGKIDVTDEVLKFMEKLGKKINK